MARRIRRASPLGAWRAFSRRHRGNSFLEYESLYALSEPLIDAILAEVPGFFAGQEEFERDLARTASFGFFHQRAMGRSSQDDVRDEITGLSRQQKRDQAT